MSLFAAYLLLIIPLSVVRLLKFRKIYVTDAASACVSAIFALQGLVDTGLYCILKPAFVEVGSEFVLGTRPFIHPVDSRYPNPSLLLSRSVQSLFSGLGHSSIR